MRNSTLNYLAETWASDRYIETDPANDMLWLDDNEQVIAAIKEFYVEIKLCA